MKRLKKAGVGAARARKRVKVQKGLHKLGKNFDSEDWTHTHDDGWPRTVHWENDNAIDAFGSSVANPLRFLSRAKGKMK